MIVGHRVVLRCPDARGPLDPILFRDNQAPWRDQPEAVRHQGAGDLCLTTERRLDPSALKEQDGVFGWREAHLLRRDWPRRGRQSTASADAGNEPYQ